MFRPRSVIVEVLFNHRKTDGDDSGVVNVADDGDRIRHKIYRAQDVQKRKCDGRDREVRRQLRKAIDDFVEVYSETAAPFEWTKATIKPTPLKKTYAESRK